MGMQGLDSVTMVLSAAVRDGNGSRHPLSQPIDANSSIFAALDETVRRAFARAEREFVPVRVHAFA